MVYYQNELYHYGIFGMKWGVRRYQNYDGTLTEEGAARLEKHYNKSKEKITNLKAKASKMEFKANKASIKAQKIEKKASKVSDENKKEKLQKKASKLERDAKDYSEIAKEYKDKVNNWVSALDESFLKINYDSIPKSDIDAGKEYAIYVNALQADLQSKINAEVSANVLKNLR